MNTPQVCSERGVDFTFGAEGGYWLLVTGYQLSVVCGPFTGVLQEIGREVTRKNAGMVVAVIARITILFIGSSEPVLARVKSATLGIGLLFHKIYPPFTPVLRRIRCRVTEKVGEASQPPIARMSRLRRAVAAATQPVDFGCQPNAFWGLYVGRYAPAVLHVLSASCRKSQAGRRGDCSSEQSHCFAAKHVSLETKPRYKATEQRSFVTM